MHVINEDASTIKTVADLLMAAKDGYDSEKEEWKRTSSSGKEAYDNVYKYSSVAKAASKMIAVFPLICSRNVSLNTAQMVSKYLEAKGAQMLQLALQATNIYSAKSGMEYLSRFHQNLNIGNTSTEVLTQAINQWIEDKRDEQEAAGKNESTEVLDNFLNSLPIVEDTTLSLAPRDLNFILNSIQEFCESSIYIKPYDTDLNPVSLNDFIVDESYGGHYNVKLSIVAEKALRDSKKQNSDNDWTSKYGPTNPPSRNGSSAGSLLKNQDVRKMNDAIPTLLVVRFYNSDNSNISTEFIVGVKTSVIPANTDEILRKIANDNEDGKFFTNLIRVGTGEIGALDFVFGLSRTAEDLAAMRKKGSLGDTWRLLQNRAYASKEQLKRGRRSSYSAITTVVITKEDADTLYREENIDITNPSVAKHFMESYNLLGFGIVNDVLESLQIIFDDDNNYFEELSYKMLQRENNSNDNIIKALNLVNKVR